MSEEPRDPTPLNSKPQSLNHRLRYKISCLECASTLPGGFIRYMCTCWLRWVDIGFSKAQAAKGYVDRVLTSEAIDKVTFAIIRYNSN